MTVLRELCAVDCTDVEEQVIDYLSWKHSGVKLLDSIPCLCY